MSEDTSSIKIKEQIDKIMKEVDSYLDLCGVSWLHLMKCLGGLRVSRYLKEYQMKQLTDRIQVNIDLSDLPSRIVEEPFYSVLDRGIEFNFWR